MNNYGYNSFSHFTNTCYFNNDMRDLYDTDWATIVFVLDSYNNPENTFTDGKFAYAYMGGPFLVMTYDNNNYQIQNMDAVMAHEYGHIFYDTDEYAQYDGLGNYIPLNQLPIYYQRSGYYNIENTNYENQYGQAPEQSIMRGGIYPYTINAISTPAKHMVGWRHTDGDNLIDVLDTEPITSLEQIPPDPVFKKLINGNTDLNPLNNQNPVPWCAGNDITINTAGVEYRIDGSSWKSGYIINNSNDFSIGPFNDGNHSVVVRATSSSGNVDLTPESFTSQFEIHFRSLSNEAIQGNGGRKVWNFGGWDPENNPNHEYIPGHFVVYEDNGDIYYTEYRYIDVVTPTYYWTDEVLLSDGSGNSKYPSMAIAFGDEYVSVIWQQYDPATENYKIMFRQKDYDYTGWESPVELTSSSTSSQSKPVTGVLNWYMGGPTYHDWFIVWDNGDVLKFSQVDTYGNVVQTIDVPETDNSLCHNPTITPTYYFGTIAWENSSEIWALDFEFSPYGSYFIDNPLNVSEGFYLMDCHSPSLTNSVYGDNAMLTWYGRRKNFDSPESESIPTPYIDPEKQYRILARKKDDSGEWGGLKVISYDDGHHNLNPSIGSANNDDFSLLWKVDNSDLVARLDYIEGQGWNYNSQIVTYDDDNINDPSASCGSGDLTAVWSKYREAPFRIVHQTLDPPTESGFKENTSTDYKLFREAKINLSLLNAHLNGNISLIFSEFQNFDNNEKILFSPDSTEKMNFMGSSLFQPDSSLQRIKFNIWIWGYDLKFNPNIENFEKDIFRVHLKRMVRNNSNSDGQILKLIKSFKLSDIIIHPNGSFLIEDQVVLDLSKYHNDILMIDTEFLSNFITNQPLSFIETFLAKDQISKFEIFSENLNKIKESDNQTVPSKFNLYPAYPNPFNPTTNIKYDLSGDSQVTLEIFDITGRRIRTLIKDFKSAGSYNAMWDGLDDLGNSVSSGLYVYRLQINIIPTKANNPDVKNKFVQIRKMLLIK